MIEFWWVWVIAIVAVAIYAAIRERGDTPMAQWKKKKEMMDEDVEKYHARYKEQADRAERQLDRLDKLHDREEAVWDRIESLVKRLEDRLDKS